MVKVWSVLIFVWDIAGVSVRFVAMFWAHEIEDDEIQVCDVCDVCHVCDVCDER